MFKKKVLSQLTFVFFKGFVYFFLQMFNFFIKSKSGNKINFK